MGKPSRRSEHFSDIITNDPVMLERFQYIEAVAPSPQQILVTGETGTGKELFARAIHKASGLKGPLVTVNAAGLDDTVFSDTLFGHVKGAFTDAIKPRPGLISKAAGGTIFLDEIGELSPMSQVKLLRLLQEDEYLPLGSDEPLKSKARIVAATNEDLWMLQKKGRFRHDLNFRLRAHHVNIPALRERLGDLPLLVPLIMRQAAETFKKEPIEPTVELYRLLESYFFPGNIRELQSMLYNLTSQCRDGRLPLELIERHIEASRRMEDDPDKYDTVAGRPVVMFSRKLPTLKEVVQLTVREALRRTDNNQTQAAKLLGITQQALSKRLKQEGMKE